MKTIIVDEEYQTGYVYPLSEPEGKNFHPDFTPDLTPQQILQAGIFGGDYFNEIPSEFPREWFNGVGLSKAGGAQASLNYFKVNAS